MLWYCLMTPGCVVSGAVDKEDSWEAVETVSLAAVVVLDNSGEIEPSPLPL